MNFNEFARVTLQGVMCQSDASGSLTIQRRVVDKPNSLGIVIPSGKPMEIACSLATGQWQGAFFYPAGDADDKTMFMTWVVHVHKSILDDVVATCQPRELWAEGKSPEQLAKEAERDRLAAETKARYEALGLVVENVGQ